MDQDEFRQLEEAFRRDGPDAVFNRLVAQANLEHNHRLLFGARLMQTRHRLGLPLIEIEPVVDVAEDQRPAYECAFRDAAREAGGLCLAAGDIVSAWPYFKALGEPAPVAAAIENVTGGDHLDRIIEIAFQEGANPRRGFELILEHHGICRAITWFGANQDAASRQTCLKLLVRTLHQEIAGSLRETIASKEGSVPETQSIAALMAGRDWLFEGNSYYVDSTHLASILRFTPELEDPEMLRMALEMAEYGQRLAPMFHFRSDPPFEDIYLDHAIYLKALLHEDEEAALAHFRQKTADAADSAPAEVMIDLLTRLGRHQEAIAASLEYFPESVPPPRACPTAVQLCQMAGDYAQLRTVARRRQDLLAFAAGVIQS